MSFPVRPCSTVHPVVVSVSRSATHGFSKQVQQSIRLIAGEGVEGDAHRGLTTQHLYLKRRDASLPNLTQVHLLASEVLDELSATGDPVLPGESGENILTRGCDLLALPVATILHIGADAVVEATGFRTPCIRMDRFQSGLQQRMWTPADAAGKRVPRAGIMGVVRVGGLVRPGDTIRVTLPPEPHRALGPV